MCACTCMCVGVGVCTAFAYYFWLIENSFCVIIGFFFWSYTNRINNDRGGNEPSIGGLNVAAVYVCMSYWLLNCLWH